MDFAAALSDFDHTANRVMGTPCVVGTHPCNVIFSEIELLQPWGMGGQEDIPTCEVQILRADYTAAHVVIGATRIAFDKFTVRVLSEGNGPMGDVVMLRCGRVD